MSDFPNMLSPNLGLSVINTIKAANATPSEMDRVLRSAGAIPMLLNVFGSTEVIDRVVGKAVAIPIHIGPGGRKSLYETLTGEKILSHIIIADNKVYVQYWERIAGVSAVSNGDIFRRELRGLDGTIVDTFEGRFNLIDGNIGHGEIIDENNKPLGTWWAWSFYAEF